jgi:PRTRC genetic system protein C
MSLNPVPIARCFLYNGRTLADPNPAFTPEQVKQFYSAIHADLTNAAIEGGQFEGDTQTWEFKRGVGTKG